MNDSIEDRLVDLQTRIAYQEDTLRQLDAVSVAQAARIERLELALRQLSQRLDGVLEGGDSTAGDEPPPHY